MSDFAQSVLYFCLNCHTFTNACNICVNRSFLSDLLCIITNLCEYLE
jgi:recombinational DNA repair protein RecR